VVLGLDALDTGVRMLPASVGLFVAAFAGSALSSRFAPRPLVRTGLAITFLSTLLLLGTIEPELDNTSFLIAMAVLGIGIGLVTSQLGNVVQSSVGNQDRSEAGGLQNTAQQLGSSLGTALLGAIVITGLVSAFTANVEESPEIGDDVAQEVEVRVSAGVSFVDSAEVEAAAREEGLDDEQTQALVDDYEDAQLKALKTAILFAAFIVLAAFWFTRRLPTSRFSELQAEADQPARAAPA
jgi:hypothetical protein